MKNINKTILAVLLVGLFAVAPSALAHDYDHGGRHKPRYEDKPKYSYQAPTYYSPPIYHYDPMPRYDYHYDYQPRYDDRPKHSPPSYVPKMNYVYTYGAPVYNYHYDPSDYYDYYHY